MDVICYGIEEGEKVWIEVRAASGRRYLVRVDGTTTMFSKDATKDMLFPAGIKPLIDELRGVGCAAKGFFGEEWGNE